MGDIELVSAYKMGCMPELKTGAGSTIHKGGITLKAILYVSNN